MLFRSLALHPAGPHLVVGSLNVVVAVATVRCLGKVSALATGSGVCPADGEVLGHTENHQLLWHVQGEGQRPTASVHCTSLEPWEGRKEGEGKGREGGGGALLFGKWFACIAWILNYIRYLFCHFFLPTHN